MGKWICSKVTSHEQVVPMNKTHSMKLTLQFAVICVLRHSSIVFLRLPRYGIIAISRSNKVLHFTYCIT